MYVHDGKLKKQSSIDQWEDFKSKFPENAFEYFRKNDKLLSVLIHIKRCFNITPIKLKTSNDKDVIYFRELALFLLVNYSNASHEEIMKEFKIKNSELKKYQNIEYFVNKYKKEIELYFKDKIDDFANNRFSQIHFLEDVDIDKLVDIILEKEIK
jgi:hypothetical protein